MTKSGFEYRLKEIIPMLKEFEPAQNLWERISSNLDFEVEAEKAVSKLATFSPDENLWSRIDNKLNQRANSRIKIIKLLSVPVSIAAMLLLIVTIYLAFIQNNYISTSYSEEIVMEWQNIQETSDYKGSNNPEIFILQACTKHPFICETDEFKEKWALLNDLNQNLQEINGEINRYGSSVSLEKSKAKLENLRSEVVKDLIKQILS